MTTPNQAHEHQMFDHQDVGQFFVHLDNNDLDDAADTLYSVLGNPNIRLPVHPEGEEPVIAVMWQLFAAQLARGPDITLARDVIQQFSVDDIYYLMSAYELATGLQAMLVRDACIDRFILGSIQFFHTKNVIHVGEQYPVMFPLQWSEPLPRTDPHFVDAGPLVVNHGRASESQVLAADAAEAEVVETTKSGKDKIPRPPNAFILYRKDQHPLIVDGMGDDKIHNNQVSVIIGKMWQTETPEVRAHYKALADSKKAEHLLEHPGYSYHPRKPSQKKRRNTKNKIAKAKTLSQAVANRYGDFSQKTGRLGGNLIQKRTATLPLSRLTKMSIEEHNRVHHNDNESALCQATPVNLTQAPEYAAAEYFDVVVQNAATMSNFVSNGLHQGHMVGSLYEDPYELTSIMYPDEWSF